MHASAVEVDFVDNVGIVGERTVRQRSAQSQTDERGANEGKIPHARMLAKLHTLYKGLNVGVYLSDVMIIRLSETLFQRIGNVSFNAASMAS